MCADRLPTFHIAEPGGLLDADEVRHRPVGSHHESVSRHWLPSGPISVGLTAGASTPDNLVEQVIRRLDVLANP